MLGAAFGLAFAVTFGANSIITRRGVLRASGSYVANVSILSGPVFFLVIAAIVGDVFKLGQFSLQSYFYFAIAGVVHFAFGRTFGYKSLQLIGVTRSNIVTGLSTIVSVGMAVAFLHEPLTPLVVLGILISLLGPVLITLKDETIAVGSQDSIIPGGRAVDRPTLYRGLLYGAGSAIFWGSSPLFIKLGMASGGTSIVGNLTSFTAAALFISPSFVGIKVRRELLNPDFGSLKLALMSGFTTNLAQMLRFLALAYTSVTVVSLMQRTIPVWSLGFAYVFNRKLESFGPWVLLGNGLLLAGSILVMLEQFWPG